MDKVKIHIDFIEIDDSYLGMDFLPRAKRYGVGCSFLCINVREVF